MALLTAIACKTAHAIPTVVEEPPLPDAWVADAAAGAADDDDVGDEALTVRFALRQRNIDLMKSLAWNASDPSNEQAYGNFLLPSAIARLVAPAESDVAAVTDWLSSVAEGAIVKERNALITLSTTARAAGALLGTSFRRVVHRVTGQRALRAGPYRLPARVAAALAAEPYGPHGLPLPRSPPPAESAPPRPTAQIAAITPAVLRRVYGIDAAGVVGTGSTKNRNAVAEFEGQTISTSDLTKFFKRFVPGADRNESKVYAYVGDKGATSGDFPGSEATLDIQYIKGVAPKILTEYWYYKPMTFCGDLKRWTTQVLGDDDGPLVHSVSYGYQGNFSTEGAGIGCTPAQRTDLDSDFAKIAAAGITVVVASGDAGSGYLPTQQCAGGAHAMADTALAGHVSARHANLPGGASDCCSLAFIEAGWTFGSNQTCTIYSTVTGQTPSPGATSGVREPEKDVRLFPAWPSSSPWVTAVGATRFRAANTTSGEQIASQAFLSGGGFSWHETAPSSEAATVASYLAHAPQLPPRYTFAAGGRATPDVSALGENYQVVCDGFVAGMQGTSASTPVVAAMASLLNAARLKRGMAPLGLLTPLIWQHPEAFTDVVVGSNAVAAGFEGRSYGFNATAGWDPVTGWGVPDFPALLKIVLSVG